MCCAHYSSCTHALLCRVPVGDCDHIKYAEWLQQEYTGILAADPNFWRYQTIKQFVLTNEIALDLALDKCTERFDLLYLYKAGRSGPIDIQTSYKAMCSTECMENDKLHVDAMKASSCTCRDLSTPKEAQGYNLEADWCRHNSARLLCDLVGFCGVWDCRLDDFTCPRYEWNKKQILFKGLGTCVKHTKTFNEADISAAPRQSEPALLVALLAAALAAAVMLAM